MTTSPINYPRVASRAEWLAERVKLLEQEKQLTRARDRLNTARRQLPMVRIEEDYGFDSPAGPVKLLDLFAGSRQLIVYHFMWRWEYGQPLDEPCKGCAGFGDQVSRGHLTQLRTRHTRFVMISRAPLAKIMRFKFRMGWNMPWYSSAGTRFNQDFGVTFDGSVATATYNYRTKEEHIRAGSGYYFEAGEPFDLHGMSCFLQKDGAVYHTYSTYGRGMEDVLGPLRMMDLTALGRQESWEEPKDRAPGLVLPPGPPARYPDEYEE
ncbi:MAG TPA: DUF899 domain-containing protein [Lacunisphaera sp.]|nr:DUF899 domain-containing protein [Lacunisphaera sp.]